MWFSPHTSEEPVHSHEQSSTGQQRVTGQWGSASPKTNPRVERRPAKLPHSEHLLWSPPRLGGATPLLTTQCDSGYRARQSHQWGVSFLAPGTEAVTGTHFMEGHSAPSVKVTNAQALGPAMPLVSHSSPHCSLPPFGCTIHVPGSLGSQLNTAHWYNRTTCRLERQPPNVHFTSGLGRPSKARKGAEQ